jgi:predicted ATPase
MQGAKGVPAYATSVGTLLSLGLLTILTSKDPPRLVLIEDLESGLHPRALQELIGQLRRIQDQNKDLQIIATSHSPYLLDSFAAEEILLTSLDDNGHGQVRCLADHPDYERWKDLMAPGEFWSSVGESWPSKDKKATAA